MIVNAEPFAVIQDSICKSHPDLLYINEKWTLVIYTFHHMLSWWYIYSSGHQFIINCTQITLPTIQMDLDEMKFIIVENSKLYIPRRGPD